MARENARQINEVGEHLARDAAARPAPAGNAPEVAGAGVSLVAAKPPAYDRNWVRI